MYISTKYNLKGEREEVLVKLIVQIGFFVKLCLTFVYNKDVGGFRFKEKQTVLFIGGLSI